VTDIRLANPRGIGSHASSVATSSESWPPDNPEKYLPSAQTGSNTAAPASGRFKTTHWSVVLAAAAADAPAAQDALNRLCSTYWYPLYAWMRRQGYSPHDAQDLAQTFFIHLFDKERLRTTSPQKGKFRSFLLASLKHFLANERDKVQALKRGGKVTFISIDVESSEGRFHLEPAHHATPDKAFEQSWAMTLLDAVLEQLRQEYAADGKDALYEALKGSLSGDKASAPYLELAVALNLSEGAIKMAVLRLRRRFGELLRKEIAHTVTSPEEIDEEIRALFAAVQR
jgi:DNA-directed RNA polymerase specialized sigma24 family protein